VKSIVLLLSKDLLKPVLIATCIALPVGYWATEKWLQNFAYKTSFSWRVFLIAAITTFGIAFVTVCFKAIKAAMANPVKSLRSE
jgi:putative ABC transport system permease protein